MSKTRELKRHGGAMKSHGSKGKYQDIPNEPIKTLVREYKTKSGQTKNRYKLNCVKIVKTIKHIICH